MGCISWSVLDFQTSKHCRAFNPQNFLGKRGIDCVATRLVFHASEHARTDDLDFPGLGNNDFASPEDQVDLEHGLAVLHIGVRKVQLKAAKNGVDPAALEVF